MKKTTTKTAPKMRGGGKVSTMKTKGFKAGGTTSKKKYAMGTTVKNTSTCGPGDGCAEGNYNKGRGTGPMSKIKASIQKMKMNIGAGKVKKVKV